MNTENNKLLAEFLGLETGKQLGYDRFQQDWFDNKGVLNGQRNSNLLFDSDWNWLMKIVEKINVICDYRFTVNIQSMDVQIQDHTNGGNVVDYFSENGPDKLIVSVYTACVEFVKWYNLQNTKLCQK